MMTEKYPTWLTGHVKEWAEKRRMTVSSASRLSALAIRLRNSLAGSNHCIDNAPRTNTPSVHG